MDTENTELVNGYECSIQSWDDLPIKNDLLRGIYGNGFEKPSPIQRLAIKPMFDRRDVIGQAQSGTGKTGTFSIGTLQVIDTDVKQIQAIIMSPTHELAFQIKSVVEQIGSMMKNLTVQLIVGGTSIQDDREKIRNNTPQIIVGTPGRIYDLIKRNILNTRDIKLFVLDEADDMLSAGFKEQIYNIYQYLPKELQTCIFSATMPEEILDLTKKFMTDPVKFVMEAPKLNLECIQQFFVAVGNDHAKYDMLKHIMNYVNSQCIIYVNSVKRVNDLYGALRNDNFSVECIHRDMSKQDRHNAYQSFKSGAHKILISSNITARGIDIQQVGLVINFDIPSNVHTYLHRIGRSGRWGRKGFAINFITKHDVNLMKYIENYYKTDIKELPIDDNLQRLLNL